MAPLSKKQRQAMPNGLPFKAHNKLLEKFGIIALYLLVHPNGNRGDIDPLRQFADCQTNLVAQKDLYEAFNARFDNEDDKQRILGLLAQFAKDHTGDNAMKLTALRTMEDVLDKAPWNEELIQFCANFAEANPKTYRINQLGFALNTDVTLFRDVGNAIANWTCDYQHAVFDDDRLDDEALKKADAICYDRRPFLKKEGSELARLYTNDRLLECTSQTYRDTPIESRLRPWPNVADQVHALLPIIVSTMQQKNGPDVTVGSLPLEVAAWYIINLHDGHPFVFTIRRREMTPIEKSLEIAAARLTVDDDDDNAEASEAESEGEGKPQVDKTYRTTAVYTFIALPNEGKTDYVLYQNCPEHLRDATNGFGEFISYYDKGQKGDGLDSADDKVFLKTALATSPFMLMLPMLMTHDPHPGNAESNDPQWDLYEKVSPPHQTLKVTRTSFQGLTFGPSDPDRKEASINDWAVHGAQLGIRHNQRDTREYDFFVPKHAMTMRKEPLDCAVRHLLMGSFNEASRHAKQIMGLQKKADDTGATVGGYGCRIKNMILNTLTKADGDAVMALSQSNPRLNKYKETCPNNKVFSDLCH